jgi:hypothetical protein
MSLSEHDLAVLRAIHDWDCMDFRAAYRRVPEHLVSGIISRLMKSNLIHQDSSGSYLATEEGMRYVYPPKNVVRVKTRRKS